MIMIDRNEKRKNLILTILLIMDIIIIIYMVLVKATIPLILFDTFVSLVLLIDIGFEIKHGVDKKKSLKDNIIPIIANIPYDLILLGSGLSLLKFLRLFRIIKILKIASIINPIIRKIEQINNKIHIDKLVIFIVGILLIGALIISLVEDISFFTKYLFCNNYFYLCRLWGYNNADSNWKNNCNNYFFNKYCGNWCIVCISYYLF